MKYEIVELTAFSGEKATVYSIKIDDDDSLFEKFIDENRNVFPAEVKSLLQNITQI